MRLVDRISSEISEARIAAAVRLGCSTCDKHRHYFDDFYVPGIAERQAELMPVFQAARERLQEIVKRNRIMTGNRYTGFMYKPEALN